MTPDPVQKAYLVHSPTCAHAPWDTVIDCAYLDFQTAKARAVELTYSKLTIGNPEWPWEITAIDIQDLIDGDKIP